MFESEEKGGSIKLIDFGISKLLEKEKKFTGVAGTVQYMAPEVLKHCYDEKADVWSLGIILHILLVGYPPFLGENREGIIQAILKQPLEFDTNDWMPISEEARELVQVMLDKNPESRVTAEMALKYPWFKTMKTPAIKKNQGKETFKRLMQYNNSMKIQSAIWIFITNFLLGRKDVNRMANIFRALDKDKDGRISKEELQEGYERIFGQPINKVDLEKIMGNLDIDKSGYIEYSEFIMAVADKDVVLTKQRLGNVFHLIDKDKKGSISIKELRDYFQNAQYQISDQEWNELTKGANKNGDGSISLQEFITIMTKSF